MNIIKETYQLLPNNIKTKRFLFQSFINNLLDLISIGTLIPLILFIIDRVKFEVLWINYFGSKINNQIIIITICAIILFFIVKNTIQIAILKNINRAMYNIANEISKNLIQKFIYDDFNNYNKTNKNKLIQDVLIVPIDFVKNVFLQLIFIGNELLLLLIILGFSLYFSFKITLLIISIVTLLFYLLSKVKKKKLKYLDEEVINKYHISISNLTNVLF